MKTRKMLLGIGFAAAAVFAIVACGSGSTHGGSSTFSCNGTVGPCSNDPQLTAAGSTQCSQAVSGSCGSQYTALENCVFAHPSCDSNGVSTNMDPACASENQAYVQCLVGGGAPDAASGG